MSLPTLKPRPKNPRKPWTGPQRTAFQKSLAEYGDLGGVVRNRRTGHLVGGHKRTDEFREDKSAKVEITQKFKKPDRCGTVAVGWITTNGTRFAYREVDWPEHKEAAANLAANQHGADFDMDLVTEMLGELPDGFDMELTGFNSGQIEQMLAGSDVVDTAVDLCRIPELRKKWQTELGQLWHLGEHRMICGDSTDKATVERLLGQDKPHLMVTDPPYGVEYDADRRNKRLRKDGTADGGRAIGAVKNDDRSDWLQAWMLFPGEVAYVWHAGLYSPIVEASMASIGFVMRAHIIWLKQHLVIGRGDYHWMHEPCWYAVRKGKNGHWTGDRKQTTCWAIDKPQKSETGHSTQKPIECMARPMRNNSKVGDYVYDPFLGSGTSIIAGHDLKRKVLGVELNPDYVAVILDRFETHTGIKPKLVK